MPPPSDSQLIRKWLRKFRLAMAQATLRNVRNTLLVSTDIQDAHHITELCDAYALGTLANWLATKYGFPAYTSFIESSCRMATAPLESWPAIADEYPFDSIFPEYVRYDSLSEGYAFLDAHVPARLDLLGTLYEEITAACLEIDELGRPYIERNGHRRSCGQFYTPPWVVRYCLEQVFSKGSVKLISTIEEDASRAAGGRPADRMQFKLLDPACGSGNFLVGVLDYLSDCGMSPGLRLAFAQQSLYGIEVDGRAASLCRIVLILSLSDVLGRIAAESIDAAASAIARVVAALREHVVVSDTMLAASREEWSGGPCGSPEAGRDWTLSDMGSFDIVVGNPPYISFGSRNQSKLCDSLSRYLRRCYPEAAEYKIRTHSIFQDIALRYARSSGKVCLLLPDAFLNGRYYRRLRSKLLMEAQILTITEFTDDIIGDATVGRWCVAAYERRCQADRAENPNYDVDLYSFSRDRSLTLDSQNGRRPKPAKSYRLPISVLVSDDCARFELVFSDTDRSLWTALRKLPRLGSVVRGHTGMRSRVGQAAIVSKRKASDAWRRGLSSGSAVTRHAADWDGTWLNVEPRLLFSGGFNPEVIDGPKLLVRQTADRVVAAYDASGLYHLNNVHSFSPLTRGNGSEVELWYLDGLLNSTFWLYLYQLKSRESGRALAQIDIEMLEAMPLPEVGRQADSPIVISRLAQAAGKLAAEIPQPDGCQETRRLILTYCERSIDRLVYDLYDVTAEDVEHVERICEPALSTLGPLPQSCEARHFAEALASGHCPGFEPIGDLPRQLRQWIPPASTRISRTATTDDHNAHRRHD